MKLKKLHTIAEAKAALLAGKQLYTETAYAVDIQQAAGYILGNQCTQLGNTQYYNLIHNSASTVKKYQTLLWQFKTSGSTADNELAMQIDICKQCNAKFMVCVDAHSKYWHAVKNHAHDYTTACSFALGFANTDELDAAIDMFNSKKFKQSIYAGAVGLASVDDINAAAFDFPSDPPAFD